VAIATANGEDKKCNNKKTVEEESADPYEKEDSDEFGKDDNDEDAEDTEDDYEGWALLQEDILCLLQDKPAILNSWMLLDSQYTVEIFPNPRMLTNI